MNTVIISQFDGMYACFEAAKSKAGNWYCRHSFSGFYGTQWTKWEPVACIELDKWGNYTITTKAGKVWHKCEENREQSHSYRLPKDSTNTEIKLPEDQLFVQDKYSDNNGAYQVAHVWQDGKHTTKSNVYDQHCDFHRMTLEQILAY